MNSKKANKIWPEDMKFEHILLRNFQIWTNQLKGFCKLQWTTHTLLPYKELHFWNEFQCTGVSNRPGINYWKCYCLLWWEKLQICEAFIAMAITKCLCIQHWPWLRISENSQSLQGLCIFCRHLVWKMLEALPQKLLENLIPISNVSFCHVYTIIHYKL